MGLTFVMSSLVLAPLGMLICGLCYLLAGLQWSPWILSLGLGLGSFLAIVWSAVAELLHQPRTLCLAKLQIHSSCT